ncbi:hypothetical protein ACTXT7_015395 [Hymenolepis weldensis]
MSRTRPRSLNLRTPAGGIYGNTSNFFSNRRSPSRTTRRYCQQCAYYPMVTSSIVPGPYVNSPAFYPVSYLVPMMYAPTPAPPPPSLSPPRFIFEEPLPLPEIPYPNYETDTTDSGELDDLRTEETLSTFQRNYLRKSETNLIRDFEETKWMSINDNMKDVQEWTLKRNHWFQRSVELPAGVITRLRCEQLPMESGSTLRKHNLQRLKIAGRVRQWSPTQKAITEEEFSEIVILPQGTDMSTIEYKLQTKNIRRYNEENFTSTLRHQQTSYDDLDDPTFTENTVVITGRVERLPQPEAITPTHTWSKEYTQFIKGTVDLSPEGRVVNPTISSYSELPDSLVKLAPTPDQDTSYEVLNDGCQIRIRLDKNVDRDSVQLQVDPIEETVKVVFARHSEENINGVSSGNEISTTTTTNYDMEVSQIFELSSRKFDIRGISKRIQDRDLLLFIPFAKGFHPNVLKTQT